MKPREIYEPKGMTTSEFVSLMKQSGFPKYSGAANSLCNHAELTGVCLSNKAQSVFKAPRAERRTKPNKFTFRLLDEDAEALNDYLRRTKQSVQDVAELAVLEFLAKEAWDVRP